MTTRWDITPRTEENIIYQLLKNRGIPQDQLDNFLNPKLSDLKDPMSLKGVREASLRISEAVKNKEKITIYGDYDVDGVSATAVLWEAVNQMGGQVMPYIPSRFSEGYGVNKEAVQKLAADGTKLIISVDSGIGAFEEIKEAKKLGIDFIITDHHTLPPKLPDALAIIHTTELAGVGVAYKLAQTLIEKPGLDLVALGTIADVVPLVGENRILARFGLEELRRTLRPGLLALYEEAAIVKSKIGTYEVGYIIDPRINAMGRLEHALDSLRILLTRDAARARELAKKLSVVNSERQRKTLEMLEHARGEIGDGRTKKLWVVSHDSYEQGIIGLIAGRLTDEWSRPVIAIAEGGEISKGSARSIEGFNVVEAISQAKDLLIAYGGHPQAAGFTIETKNVPAFRKVLQEYIEDRVEEENLRRKFVVDCVVKSQEISLSLAKSLQQLAPFGVGNKDPLFMGKSMRVGSTRTLSDNKHLKLELDGIEAIGFGMGPRNSEIRPGMLVDALFHIEENIWMDKSRLQLKLRDFHLHT